MTNDHSYRLGNYRITVSDDVLVRWERHVPLAMARSGTCFLLGEVLIIGNKFHDEDGFQIGEFLDSLRKLPPWTGTRYYCYSGELLDAVTGQSLIDEALARYSSFADKNNVVPESAALATPGTYCLGHYRIIATADGRITWQAHEGLNGIIGGPCSVESGILVIGPQEHDEPGESKKEFFDALDTLQPWERTQAWCRGSVLRLCRDMKQEEKRTITSRLLDTRKNLAAYRETAQSNTSREPIPGRIPKPVPVGHYGETTQRLLLSCMNPVKSAWQRVRTGKAWWKWLLALLTAVLLLGSASAIYIAEKGVPWTHDFKKHHHKHHDH